LTSTTDHHPSRDTLAVTAGRPPVTPDGPLNVPIVPASALHAGGESGYTRSGHGPWDALEQTIGALEGGHAVTYASGMAAGSAAMRMFPPHPVIVAPTVAYMGVREGLRRLSDAGRAELRWVDITDTDAVIAAADGANVLWLESPTNPLLGIADIPRLCGHARAHGILCIVDNTVATPMLQRPLPLGADIVMHSATKALGGHSDLLLGALVTRDTDLLARLREIRVSDGATPGALEVFLCLRGIRTLPLRLERSQANAAELAARLSDDPEVLAVGYPGLATHPNHDRASTMDGPGFMLTLRLGGGAERAEAFIARLRLAVHTTSLGGVETTLERRAKYPAEADIPADLLRVSVGCEHVEDLWADFRQAITATTSSAAHRGTSAVTQVTRA
jgi:cystathionine gamma-synthase